MRCAAQTSAQRQQSLKQKRDQVCLTEGSQVTANVLALAGVRSQAATFEVEFTPVHETRLSELHACQLERLERESTESENYCLTTVSHYRMTIKEVKCKH